uniref:Uncharacterized protein n=1 Tax=Anguilla anguilla TaxID=7936 RepID=A0A0E9QFP8_ANGAN
MKIYGESVTAMSILGP